MSWDEALAIAAAQKNVMVLLLRVMRENTSYAELASYVDEVSEAMFDLDSLRSRTRDAFRNEICQLLGSEHSDDEIAAKIQQLVDHKIKWEKPTLPK